MIEIIFWSLIAFASGLRLKRHLRTERKHHGRPLLVQGTAPSEVRSSETVREKSRTEEVSSSKKPDAFLGLSKRNIGVAVGVLAVGGLLVWWQLSSPTDTLEFPVGSIAIAVCLLLIALFFSGMLRNVAMFLLISIVVAYVGPYLYSISKDQIYKEVYGPEKWKEVESREQERNATRALEGKSEEAQTSRRRGRAAATVVERQVSWPGHTGETLPVNEWSEWTDLQVGCSVRFPAYEGIFEIQYRAHSAKIRDHIPHTSPNMSSFRYKVLQEGVTDAPYKLTCTS